MLSKKEYEHYKNLEKKEYKTWKPAFKPDFEFTNQVEVHKDTPEQHYPYGEYSYRKFDNYDPIIGCDCKKSHFCRIKYLYDVTFSEEMDLRSFPMDCQKFRIILRQSGSIPFRFMPEPIVQTEKAAAFTRMDTKYSILDEWDLHSTAVKFGDSRGDDSRSKKTYSEVAVHFRLRRKYSVYFWNFTFYLMIISFLSLTCFVLNHYNSGNRLNLAVTILLTQVAFQYVVADSLPKIPYLTTLSKYIIACFVFVGTVSIESAIYVRFRIRIFDKYFGLFMLVVWAVYHLGFLFYAIYLRVDGCHKLESETDKKLQRDRKQDESHEEKKEENDKKQNDKHTQFLMPWKGLVALKKNKKELIVQKFANIVKKKWKNF